MKRIGPWIVCGALALVTVGIVSTPRLDTSTPEREVRIDMAGVTTVDTGTLSIDSITLQSDAPAVLRLNKMMRQGNELEFETKRIDQTMVFSAASRPIYYGQTYLTLPASVDHLKGRQMTITAATDIGTLRIDANNVHWTGSAKQLEVHLQPMQSGDCADRSGHEVSLNFNAGKVARLRIVAPDASVVTLGDISQVDDIELQYGPNTRVNARLADFARIRVIPVDDLPAQSTPLASIDTGCNKTDVEAGVAPSP